VVTSPVLEHFGSFCEKLEGFILGLDWWALGFLHHRGNFDKFLSAITEFVKTIHVKVSIHVFYSISDILDEGLFLS
jgi:hypothetical protein